MTHDEFIARCETIYHMGLVTEERMRLLVRWLDIVMRYEGGQTSHVTELLQAEYHRTDGFEKLKTLANDADGYALIDMAAILAHPCQQCAETPHAWHTRPGFCPHREHVDGS